MDWKTYGHNINKKYFKNISASKGLAHAYLFHGPDMVGKRTFTLDLYKFINNRDPKDDPDFFMIAPNASGGDLKIYIEDIRKLKSFFLLKTYQGPYKVAVIDDAHQLTSEAANALLKILEEPPPSSIIILVSSLSGLIPATIISRCEGVNFSETTKEESRSYISNKKLSQEDEEFLLTLAGGRIGLINRLADKSEILEARKVIEDLRKLLSSNIHERMSYAKKVHDKDEYSMKVFYWLLWVSAHVKNSPKNEKITKNLLELSNIISQPQYNKRLAFESFLLSL